MILKTLLIAAGATTALLVGWILWRLGSVGRGAKQRDERLLSLLDPLGRRLESGAPVSAGEVEALASRPELRPMLFQALRHMGKDALLPSGFRSTEDQGAAALAYWMMHPNELQDAPERIECIATLPHTVDGKPGLFHVYRYRMQEGHWAAKDAWLLGLAGPLDPTEKPYEKLPGAFSRAGDREGNIAPADLVGWYLDMLKQKGLIQSYA